MIANPEQTLTSRILATWASIAATKGSPAAMELHTDRLEHDAEYLLALTGADDDHARASAAALVAGLRREAGEVIAKVLAQQEAENLSDQTTRVRLHELLGVRDSAAITSRHLVLVNKVNSDLDPMRARRNLVIRLTTVRAMGLAKMAVRVSHAA